MHMNNLEAFKSTSHPRDGRNKYSQTQTQTNKWSKPPHCP